MINYKIAAPRNLIIQEYLAKAERDFRFRRFSAERRNEIAIRKKTAQLEKKSGFALRF